MRSIPNLAMRESLRDPWTRIAGKPDDPYSVMKGQGFFGSSV